MDFVLGPIASVFGKLLYFIYNSVGFESYALSLLLFTIVVKLLLMPLSLKQIRSSQRMQEIQPEIARIQERYKNDKEKLNEETMKLYKEKKYNPASGCLPLVVQMPILFALFFVIRMPLTYMLDVPKIATGDLIVAAVDAEDSGVMATYPNLEKNRKVKFEDIRDNRLDVFETYRSIDPYIEIKLVEFVNNNPEALELALREAPDRITNYYDLIETDPDARIALNDGYAEDLEQYTSRTSRMTGFNIKLWNFFNFGVQPSMSMDDIKQNPEKQIPALLLLLIAVVTTFISSKLMMPKPDPKAKKNPKTGCSTQSMVWMSPIMTLWFGLTTPSGLAFYWTISNVLSLAQQKLLTAHTKKSEGVGIENKEKAPIKEEGVIVIDESQTRTITSGSKKTQGGQASDKNSKKRGKNSR